MQVKTSLANDKIRPIRADSLLLETHLEAAYNSACGVKWTQLEIVSNQEERATREEEGFFQRILQQKEQEIQVQRMMKASRQPKESMKSRLEAKARKEEMLKSSLQR